jgi:hypothetical protein
MLPVRNESEGGYTNGRTVCTHDTYRGVKTGVNVLLVGQRHPLRVGGIVQRVGVEGGEHLADGQGLLKVGTSRMERNTHM